MSIHAERGPDVRHPGVGMLLVLIAAVASTAVLVLAITGSFDGAGSDDGAVPALAVPGVRTDGGPEEGAHVASGTPVPVGLRTDGGPEEGTRGIAGAVAPPAATRIGVRGVVLPAAGAVAPPAATRIGVRGVVLPAAQPGGRANPAGR